MEKGWRFGSGEYIISVLSKRNYPMRNILVTLSFVVFGISLFMPAAALGAIRTPTPSPTPTVTPTPTPEPPRPDITQQSTEILGPLERTLEEQALGPVWPTNPVKYAIRGAVDAGVPANTIVLLLLLPLVAFIIAFTRNVVGIRGFGIFLPAALAVVFVATGPFVGIGLFLAIVAVSTSVRMLLRKLKYRIQYLPRMAFILWAVVVGVLGILFAAPVLKFPDLANVSIFAVLVMILLAEDFTRVQLGKSINTAFNLTFETLILSLVSYLFLTFKPLQNWVLLNPELSLLGIGVLDLLLGKYTGLRIMEFYRFRKLIQR
ncbi:MAG TPA: 7TM domain-containing protein [Patescibacteria group bacterium]|nr:7TM domain-containing protein [Patescibacteria group bacterium]